MLCPLTSRYARRGTERPERASQKDEAGEGKRFNGLIIAATMRCICKIEEGSEKNHWKCFRPDFLSNCVHDQSTADITDCHPWSYPLNYEKSQRNCSHEIKYTLLSKFNYFLTNQLLDKHNSLPFRHFLGLFCINKIRLF